MTRQPAWNSEICLVSQTCREARRPSARRGGRLASPGVDAWRRIGESDKEIGVTGESKNRGPGLGANPEKRSPPSVLQRGLHGSPQWKTKIGSCWVLRSVQVRS